MNRKVIRVSDEGYKKLVNILRENLEKALDIGDTPRIIDYTGLLKEVTDKSLENILVSMLESIDTRKYTS